jgi:hypothetical protein
MIRKEQRQHDAHSDAQNCHECKCKLCVEKIPAHYPVSGLHSFTRLVVDEFRLPNVLLLDNAQEDEYADDSSIGADDRMTAYEHQEIAVVVEAHTVVYPNAVVIKLLNAHIAHATVLRPGRLRELASLTLVILQIYQIIIGVSLARFLVIVFVDDPRRAPTGYHE